MADPLIGSIRSYDDANAIRRFVRRALRVDPDILGLLRRTDPSRLVVVKPNWIQESHERDPEIWEPVITHPNLLMAVMESLAEEMDGRGTICLCDAPHTYADFDRIIARGDLAARLQGLRDRWPSLTVEWTDLRREVWTLDEGVIVGRRSNPPDPRGYVRFDLGRESLFFGYEGEGRYYGADYDSRPVNEHHRGERHEYLLSGTAVACDLFVNVPKLKTHKKTGITCCLKNLVGINGDKNWLPHHTEGSPKTGGDEFPDDRASGRFEGAVKRTARRVLLGSSGVGSWFYRKMRKVGMRIIGDSGTVVRNGNWHGNDTCWRMALDLNRGLLFGRPDGTWGSSRSPKRYLAIVDGIIGGEGNGPLAPDPVGSGVLLAGTNPAILDAVAARLMGFEPADLPIVARSFEPHRWPIADREIREVTVRDDRARARLGIDEVEPAVPSGFRPHFGWSSLQKGKDRGGA